MVTKEVLKNEIVTSGAQINKKIILMISLVNLIKKIILKLQINIFQNKL